MSWKLEDSEMQKSLGILATSVMMDLFLGFSRFNSSWGPASDDVLASEDMLLINELDPR